MKAVSETVAASTRLRPEWERIELLVCSLSHERLGRNLPEPLLERLKVLGAEVEQLRCDPESPWQVLLASDPGVLGHDLLALVIAPEVEPRIGWLYQQLQPGSPSVFLSVALARELLALDEPETGELFALLDEGSVLRRTHLLRVEGQGPHQLLLPGPGAAARLMDWPRQLASPLGAVRVWSPARWKDLVLPADCLNQLREFLHWIRERRRVVAEWGGQDSGGPVALFTGPPGTGKTLAASVVANDLDFALFRIDLGAVVSKYIGETEKNLNRIFDAAHGQPMVLLFDEADSLFGQRGEIKDARDRWANMEVSHLLSRIEAHQGPVVLTTNMRRQLDSAFTRRFQVVVDFPRPDSRARSELWAKSLPPRAPLTPEVDPQFLGSTVTLTGGAIRNAALHAAFVAAGTHRPIGLPEIALAVWRELAKDGREVKPLDLGGLAQWLPEELICL
jgi:hypothetical protein